MEPQPAPLRWLLCRNYRAEITVQKLPCRNYRAEITVQHLPVG
jgi:hypothetical protein